MKNEDYQIFGIRAIIEAINAGKNLDKVFIQKGLKGDLIKEMETLVRKNGIELQNVQELTESSYKKRELPQLQQIL